MSTTEAVIIAFTLGVHTGLGAWVVTLWRDRSRELKAWQERTTKDVA